MSYLMFEINTPHYETYIVEFSQLKQTKELQIS